MAHPIPKELKGEERIFTIPFINVHINKKGLGYNGIATIIAAVMLKLTNFWVFLVLFLVLNITVYPLAHMKTQKNRFEGGNVPYDRYFLRKFKYKKNQNVYIRKRGK